MNFMESVPVALRFLWPFLLLPIPLVLWLIYRARAHRVGADEPPPRKDELDHQIEHPTPGVPERVVEEEEFDTKAASWRRITYQWLMFCVVWIPLWFILSIALNVGAGAGWFIAIGGIAFLAFIVSQAWTIGR